MFTSKDLDRQHLTSLLSIDYPCYFHVSGHLQSPAIIFPSLILIHTSSMGRGIPILSPPSPHPIESCNFQGWTLFQTSFQMSSICINRWGQLNPKIILVLGIVTLLNNNLIKTSNFRSNYQIKSFYWVVQLHKTLKLFHTSTNNFN